MFKRILVPVDGSATSLQAVRAAIGLAQSLGAAVSLVCVIDPYPFVGVGEGEATGLKHYLSAALAEAQRAIHAAQTACKSAGLSTDSLVVENRAPFEGILEAAKGQGADLIVMGSHGRTGLQKLLLGSVTQKLLSHAEVPVMVVRGE